MHADKTTELSRIKLKTWTRQPVPMISEHSAHLTPLSVDFRTWLRRYTYLLLLISMLWHRQAIFKSKGDQSCSSAELQDWNPGSQTPNRQADCPYDAQPTDKPTELSKGEDQDTKLRTSWQNWAIDSPSSPSLWSASIQPTWPHCQLTFAPGSGDIHICCC